MKPRTLSDLQKRQAEQKTRDNEIFTNQEIARLGDWTPSGGGESSDEFKWFELTAVASSPMTGKEQTCSNGTFTDVNTDSISVYPFPQIDITHYAVGNHVFAHYVGNCWVALYNTPVAFDEC